MTVDSENAYSLKYQIKIKCARVIIGKKSWTNIYFPVNVGKRVES
jgi:hypothetical protein